MPFNSWKFLHYKRTNILIKLIFLETLQLFRSRENNEDNTSVFVYKTYAEREKW